MSKKGKNVFLVGMLGAIAGVIGGLLLAPKSGKETRDDIKKLALKLSKEIKTNVEDTESKVKEVFGEVTDATLAKYKEIRTMVIDKVAAVKTAGKEIDKEKYGKIVEDVVEEYKKDLTATKSGAVKLTSQLKKDWEKVKKALV
jgi:gas vesicle protein